MSAAAIARALGGARSGAGYIARCPVHDDRHPSLSLRDGDDRLLVYCHAGCDPRDVLVELRRRGLLDSVDHARRNDRHHERPAPQPVRPDRISLARRLWRMRRPIAGTAAERYLREARGYTGPFPATLGYLPARGEHGHAMIAAYGLPTEAEPGILAIADDAVRAAHPTRLTPDGSGKDEAAGSAKITIGSPLGSPIVLAPPNHLLGLAITEGIEDALSVHQATGLGVWAAGSAGLMPALADAVPAYVECITVYAHADRAGQDGAYRLAQALVNRGVVEVLVEGLGNR